MSSSKKTLLDPLRVRVRRLQFTGGLGFLALVLGSMLSVALSQRMSTRLQALPFDGLRLVLALGIQKLWLLLVLPMLCYGAARVVELRPWPTALGDALSGQAFLVALEFVQNGVEGWVERGWVYAALEVGLLGLGVWITQWAVARGRADVAAQEQQTRQKASARKDEYAEFLQAAERGGDKLAEREAAQSTAPMTPTGAPPDPASSPPTPTDVPPAPTVSPPALADAPPAPVSAPPAAVPPETGPRVGVSIPSANPPEAIIFAAHRSSSGVCRSRESRTH